MKLLLQSMDTKIGPAQNKEDEDLCVSDVCASVDDSEGVNIGFVDVVDGSKLATLNVCDAMDGSGTVGECVESFGDEKNRNS